MRSFFLAAKGSILAKRILLVSLLLAINLFASAQPKTISGFIKKTDDGTPLSKATVLIKGTSSGTISDEKGFYSTTLVDDNTINND